MKTYREYKEEARTTLRGHWGKMALATLVYTLIAGICGSIPFANFALIILVGMPLGYGFYLMFLKFDRDQTTDTVGSIFDGFKTYGRAIGVPLLMAVYIFLWTLLLIIPGIIKSYAYSQAYFLAKDHPDWSAEKCIHESRMMMQGHKWRLFVLDLSFIGWFLLGILSLGIGFLWIEPFVYATHVKFYNELLREKNEQAAPAAAEATATV